MGHAIYDDRSYSCSLGPVSSTCRDRGSNKGGAARRSDNRITSESGRSRAAARSGGLGNAPTLNRPITGSRLKDLETMQRHNDTTQLTLLLFCLQRKTALWLCRAFGNCGVLRLGSASLVR